MMMPEEVIPLRVAILVVSRAGNILWSRPGFPGDSGSRSAVRRDQPGHQGGQEDLAGQRLHDRDGTAAVLSRGEVPVPERGQRGEAEVLECLSIGGLVVGEKH